MIPTAENDAPMLAQAHALEGIVLDLRQRLDAANQDRARLLQESAALRGELATALEELRNERADRAKAAIQQPAVPATRPSRPLTVRESLALTVASLAALAAGCGLALDLVAVIAPAAVLLGVAGGYALLARHAPDPRHPFDLDGDASKWEAHHG